MSENALQTEARIDCEQSLSKLGRTGESEMAERESFPMASCFLLSLDFLARLTILRDCSQSKARTRKKKKKFYERKEDCPVQKFGLRRPQRFDVIQTEPGILLFLQKDPKGTTAHRVV